MKTAIVCVVYLLLTLTGVSFIKYGHAQDAFFKLPIFNIDVNGFLIMGLILYGISFLVFTFYITRLKVGIVIPLVSGIYIALIPIVGCVFFHETITSTQLMGVIIVVIGTIVIGMG